MKEGLRVFDSDMHVIEGAEVYAACPDPRYRADMPEYLGWSPTNFPHWNVRGTIIPPWAQADDVAGPQASLDAPREGVYRAIRERGYDAASMLAAMDAEGIDRTVVYRTFAHMVVSIDDLEAGYAIACCAAFNDWLAGYCATDRRRLAPAAIVSLHDPECDVLWREVARLGVALVFHGTSGAASADYVANRFRGHVNFRTLNHASAFPLELMLALAAMTAGGVLERFPDLRLGFLEGNCGWLPWWLGRLDDQWRKYGGGEKVRLSALPSEYFQRQCVVGADADEASLAAVIDALGDDNLVMSIDYPHAYGPFPHGVDAFLAQPRVGRDSKRKILWDNCLRLYGAALAAA